MHSISPEDAQAALDPYHHVLEQCIREGWKQYNSIIPGVLPLPSPRGKANMIYEFIVNEARARLGGLEGINVKDCFDGRFLVYVRNRLLLRFKKLNRSLEIGNYPTPRALAFNAQREIRGLPRCARITIGYQLNSLGTDLAGTYVLFGTSRRPVWHYNLQNPSRHTIVEIPLPADEPSEKTGRIRPKRVDVDEAGEGAAD